MAGGKFQYPEIKREMVTEDCHGTSVADPYRWLEDLDSENVKRFVEDQNKVTVSYLDQCAVKEEIHGRLTKLWNFPKYSCPYRRGKRYFFYKNTGLQNHNVLYVQDSLDGEPRVFIDPNTFSDDGTVAMNVTKFSKDGEIFAYCLSSSGSDWMTIHFQRVDTGEKYPEVLEKVKFVRISWTHDNKGIFYNRYPTQEGKTDGSETTSNEHQKLYYHRIGTKQSEDTLMAEFPDNPKWRIGSEVSDCGNYLIITCQQDCDDHLVFYASLTELLKSGMDRKLDLIPVVTKFEAEYEFLANEGTVFYFRTNKNAPNYQIAGIDVKDLENNSWTTLLAEHPKDVLNWAICADGDKLVVCYIQDVKSVLQVHSLKDGSLIKKIPIDVGMIIGCDCKRDHSELFFQFANFLTPGRIFHVDFKDKSLEAKVFREVTLEGFDPANFVTQQVFYESKDGTKVPMFTVHKKGLKMEGKNPCLLYGYGGFNISLQPTFSISRLVFIQHFDGIVAIPNIRGGGEYGQKWHDGGRLFNKQNVFDDFQAAAEYLIKNGYTNSQKLAIHGASNGGLLIGACVNQRPELFGAAIAQGGVLDMLRFHKFTIGYSWCSDYGSPDEKEHFENLLKYSPVHNVRMPEDEKAQYPAVLLLTADHDDRVVPPHSFKFIAELQQQVGKHPRQINPVMIRIDTNAGHGLGKPTNKLIEEYTDILSFIAQSLDLTGLNK